MAPRSTSTSTTGGGAGCTWATIERVELWPVGEPFLGAVSSDVTQTVTDFLFYFEPWVPLSAYPSRASWKR